MTKSSRRPRGTTLDPNHPARDLQELLTDDDKEHMRLCIDAEARGDVDGALKHYLAAPHVEGAPQLHDLQVLSSLGNSPGSSLGNAVPAWAWSRWICDQAHRWLLFEEDPRIRDAVLHTIVTVHADLDALHLEDPDELLEIGTRLAVAHWITAQLLLFEFSGLRDFVDVKATPELLGRADEMEPWAASAMGGYRIIEAHDDVIELIDLANGSRVDVLNIGAATGVERDAVVIGRVVPISTAPGLMFESRPLEVDDQTARDVSQADGLEWLNAVYEAVVTGRLPEGYGMGDHRR